MAVEAVLWDFGGVFTTSPFDAFDRYERERGLPVDVIRRINSINPDTNAWAKIERSEVDAATFDKLFLDEAKALGHDIPGRDVLALLSGDLRPAVVAAFFACKARFKVGCITNNAPTGKGAGMSSSSDKAKQIAEVFAQFDHVIESSKAGVRKPDPRIYQMMCEALTCAVGLRLSRRPRHQPEAGARNGHDDHQGDLGGPVAGRPVARGRNSLLKVPCLHAGAGGCLNGSGPIVS
jgi:putative hydrolase of the HAD superfamily